MSVLSQEFLERKSKLILYQGHIYNSQGLAEKAYNAFRTTSRVTASRAETHIWTGVGEGGLGGHTEKGRKVRRDGGKEGRRDGERERERGRDGERERGREGERERGREGERERGREGERERGREGERERGREREREREGGRERERGREGERERREREREGGRGEGEGGGGREAEGKKWEVQQGEDMLMKRCCTNPQGETKTLQPQLLVLAASQI